jgi:hypothetical protein
MEAMPMSNTQTFSQQHSSYFWRHMTFSFGYKVFLTNIFQDSYVLGTDPLSKVIRLVLPSRRTASFNYKLRPCHSSEDQLLTSNHGGSGSSLGLVMWYLWWIKWR